MMVRTKQLFLTGKVRNMLSRFVLALVIAIPAYGQAFEYNYGGDCYEEGHDVKPVVQCSGGGYIAVGTTNSVVNDGSQGCATNTDIYVVRTARNGTQLWENRYNVSLTGRFDEGNAIVECADGSGFVVAGTTRNAQRNTSDAFLMKINCNGGITWLKQYNPGDTDEAFDVVEATVGNGTTTNPGDLLVCGRTKSAKTFDGLLFRTNANGGVIWLERYDHGLGGYCDEVFYRLTETTSGPGDVVAAGQIGYYLSGTIPLPAIATTDALVERVGGNTGWSIGMSAIYGGPYDETFYSVKELLQGQEATNLIFVGMSNSPTNGGTKDFYLVKTQLDPCSSLIQMTIDNTTQGTYDEVARDVIEVTSGNMFPASQNFAAGDLALTGYADLPDLIARTKSLEMILLPVNVATLAPATSLISYGDFFSGGVYREDGYALEENGDTLILCGLSYSNLENDIHFDPEDLYLIKPDPDGVTGCEKMWDVRYDQQYWTQDCFSAAFVPETQTSDPDSIRNSITSPNSVCINSQRPASCTWCKPSIQNGLSESLAFDATLSLSITPNPIRNEGSVRLEVSGSVDDALTIDVSDITGSGVFHARVATVRGGAAILIPTVELPAGVYTITATNSKQLRSIKTLIGP